MAVWPTRGEKPWDAQLKAYIDAIFGDGQDAADAAARAEAAANRAESIADIDTTDDAMTAVAQDEDSAFRAQQLASYAQRVEPASYTYNPDGTVATETVGGLTTTYAYNSDSSVRTATRNGVTVTYTYDINGNVTAVS